MELVWHRRLGCCGKGGVPFLLHAERTWSALPEQKALCALGALGKPMIVVPAEYRGQGVAQALLKGAVAYAKKQGARVVEAYPVDKPARSKDEYMWFGAKSMYDHAGFREVARRKPHRPIVRIKPV